MAANKVPESFMHWFRTNYPGPQTIINKPDWHAPKIFAAAWTSSAAPDLLEVCLIMERVVDLWLPHVADKAHAEEARALHELHNKILAAISKAEGL